MAATPPLTIRKHWFGLLTIYLTGLVLSALLFLVLYAARGLTFPFGLLYVCFAVVQAVLWAFTFVRAYVYRASTLVIDDLGVTQLDQLSIFGTKASETRYWDIEDVSYTRTSFFAWLLNYGTLTIQTAGARNTMVFTMTPKPEFLRDSIENRVHLSTGAPLTNA